MDDFIREPEQEMTGNGRLPPILPGRFLPIVIDKGWPIESRLCDHTRTLNSGIRARSTRGGVAASIVFLTRTEKGQRRPSYRVI
jgi:hypothetical protein